LRGVAAVIRVGAYWVAGTIQPLYLDRPDEAGREAVRWIKQHLPAQSVIIARTSLWTDLHEPGLGGPAFPAAHSHWKVAQDPAVRFALLQDGGRCVDNL